MLALMTSDEIGEAITFNEISNAEIPTRILSQCFKLYIHSSSVNQQLFSALPIIQENYFDD